MLDSRSIVAQSENRLRLHATLVAGFLSFKVTRTLKFSATPAIVYFRLALLLSQPNSQLVIHRHFFSLLCFQVFYGQSLPIYAKKYNISNASGLRTTISVRCQQVQNDLNHAVILRD